MAEEEEEFTKQVLRLAITKISKQKGFQAIEKNALDTFVELMDYYIKELSESCHTYAELSERTIANHEDLEATFEDFNIDVEELFDYIEENKKPLDPIKDGKNKEKERELEKEKEREKEPVLADDEKVEFPPYIPPYLPPFPDRHTFIRTPIFKQPITDTALLQEMKCEQMRQMELNVKKFYPDRKQCV